MIDYDTFLYSNLSQIIINKGEAELSQFILSSLSTTEHNIKGIKLLNKKIDRFIIGHAERLNKKCRGNVAFFRKKYATWLQQPFFVANRDILNEENQSNTESVRRCSKTMKRKRYEIPNNQTDDPGTVEQIYIDNLRYTDRRIDANIVQKLGVASPSIKKRILQLLANDDGESVPYTTDEAVALMVDLTLGRDQYQELRMGAKKRKANIYPSYNEILKAKKRCYPSSITVSDTGAEIELQALLNHTSSRLIQICDLNVILNQVEPKLSLILKWGMDGASGQSLYKMIFPIKPGSCDDSSIFMIAPLQLKSVTDTIWSNPVPSSTKFCRPIKFEFMKETPIATNEQYEKVRSQVAKLQPFRIKLNQKCTVEISYEMELTMIDGKTVNALSSNSSQATCNIWGATPLEMNDLNRLQKKMCKTEYYHFGLSTLHCYIRFLECILHIAYRLPFQKWSVRGTKNSSIATAVKRQIQTAYKTKKGLTLDVVRERGGTSNDGNTSRRFFDDVTFAAKTTGVDEELICRFKVILTTLCCGRTVDPVKFGDYSLETAKLYCSLYAWFYMPASVHKVLLHGADIVRCFNLPIGVYSEEAQEARNKEFKRIREHNTRMFSRSATNEDIIHGLLVSSDPVITNLRRDKFKTHKELDTEVLNLLSV